jgi:alpha-tubulin suppressor-like RCC1 family protein
VDAAQPDAPLLDAAQPDATQPDAPLTDATAIDAAFVGTADGYTCADAAAPGYFQSIAAGSYHTCAVVNGGLKCWGAGSWGQLTVGGSSPTPKQALGLGKGVTFVGAGTDHTCAIHYGALKCWGRNDYYQLGHGKKINQEGTPQQVVGLTAGVSAVVGGYKFGCSSSQIRKCGS